VQSFSMMAQNGRLENSPDASVYHARGFSRFEVRRHS